jgi:hypothetical protein
MQLYILFLAWNKVLILVLDRVIAVSRSHRDQFWPRPCISTNQIPQRLAWVVSHLLYYGKNPLCASRDGPDSGYNMLDQGRESQALVTSISVPRYRHLGTKSVRRPNGSDVCRMTITSADALIIWSWPIVPFSSREMFFCETWGRDKKASLDSLACYHLECGRKSNI